MSVRYCIIQNKDRKENKLFPLKNTIQGLEWGRSEFECWLYPLQLCYLGKRLSIWASDISSRSYRTAEIKQDKHLAQYTARAQHVAAVMIINSQFHLLISNRDTDEQRKKPKGRQKTEEKKQAE